MHDLDEIANAMQKDPKKWAQMFMETRQHLDMSIVEMTSLKSKEPPPEGAMDNTRARSFTSLVNFMTKQMSYAYMAEKQHRSTNVHALSTGACHNDHLLSLRGVIKELNDIITDYANLRGLGEGHAALDPKLRANNPCKIVYSNTAQLADAEGIVHYNTPVEGLTVTLSAVQQAIMSNPQPFTYRQFFYNWFQTDSKCYQKAERACMEIPNPDAIVLRTLSYIIDVARAVVSASFDSPVDKEYIAQTFTLDAYVEAAKHL